MTYASGACARIQLLAETTRRAMSQVPRVVKRVAVKAPRTSKAAKSVTTAHVGKGVKVTRTPRSAKSGAASSRVSKVADVTIIPVAQFKRLVLSDVPQDAPGLRRMVMESRRKTVR